MELFYKEKNLPCIAGVQRRLKKNEEYSREQFTHYLEKERRKDTYKIDCREVVEKEDQTYEGI